MIRFLITLCLLLAPASTWAAWPADGSFTGWSHKFKITTQASKIDGANTWYWLDLYYFPPEFHAAAQSDLRDFVITSDGETPLSYYKVFYDAATDTGLVAVAQPHGTSGATVDVDSYVYIGNAGASSASTTSTFPSTLECLYMLQEAPTSSAAVLDHSGNARHSTSIAGSMTSGDLVTSGPHSGLHCLDLDSNDRITIPSTVFDDCETANAYTWFGWVKLRNDNANRGAFGAAGTQFSVRWDFTTGGFVAIQRNSANSVSFTGEGDVHTELEWQFVSIVYNGSTLKLYVDGIEEDSVSATSLRSAALSLFIAHDNITYWNGYMAETGFYSEALSTGQIASMHGSATDPAFWVIEPVVPDSSAPWFQILLSEE